MCICLSHVRLPVGRLLPHHVAMVSWTAVCLLQRPVFGERFDVAVWTGQQTLHLCLVLKLVGHV